MSFSENLQFLRKRMGITQEQLAEELSVSRQSVSKWESGAAYPETEKLLTMCDMFHVDLDTLLRGDAVRDVSVDKHGYDRHKTNFARIIAFATFFIIFGLSIMLALECAGVQEGLSVMLFMVFVTVSVVCYVAAGILNEQFNRKHPIIEDFYTQEQRDANDRHFAIFITAGVGLILLGTVLMLGSEAFARLRWPNEDMMTAVFMLLVSIAVGIFVYSGLMKAKFDIKDHNREQKTKVAEDKLMDAITTVIWCSATAIYLLISFLTKRWEITWIVFVVAAMTSAIAEAVVPLRRKNNDQQD